MRRGSGEDPYKEDQWQGSDERWGYEVKKRRREEGGGGGLHGEMRRGGGEDPYKED